MLFFISGGDRQTFVQAGDGLGNSDRPPRTVEGGVEHSFQSCRDCKGNATSVKPSTSEFAQLEFAKIPAQARQNERAQSSPFRHLGTPPAVSKQVIAVYEPT